MKKYFSIFAVLGVILVAGCACHKEKKINFDFDSYQLTAHDKTELDKVASTMNKNTAAKVELYGYTDSTGTAEYNMGLSKHRAKEAARYLKGKGIAADRITVKGFGKNDPVATNKTMEGRHENRRVEVTVYK